MRVKEMDVHAKGQSLPPWFAALNDIQEGKKPIKVAKPRKPASTKAPIAEPPAAFAALGGLPDDPSSQSSSGASLGRRYLVT